MSKACSCERTAIARRLRSFEAVLRLMQRPPSAVRRQVFGRDPTGNAILSTICHSGWMTILEGQSFDEFLKAKGIETKNILAFRRVLAWQLSEAMTTRGISAHELVRRIKTRPHEIRYFLESPESAPLLITTLREAMAAVGSPLITFWETVQSNCRRVRSRLDVMLPPLLLQLCRLRAEVYRQSSDDQLAWCQSQHSPPFHASRPSLIRK